MDLKLIRTSSSNSDFKLLVAELDAHLAELYGDEKAFFSTHNAIESINNVTVMYNETGAAVGCGGVKAYNTSAMEIKRMFVKPAYRGQGIAALILTDLENWAKELGFTSTILETLKVKKTVIGMYARNGYGIIPNYGQYENTQSSVCMSKKLF